MRLSTTRATTTAIATAAALCFCCSDDDLGFKSKMTLQSAAFGPGEMMPTRFTCKGSGLSPPLSYSVPPEGTRSLAVVMDEPEYLTGRFTRWLIWNLPVQSVVPEDAETHSPDGAVFGTADDATRAGYAAPCPPRGKIHQFVFQVYALDTILDLAPGADREALDAAMDGHVLAKGELTALARGR